jgi:hypothetical protein
MLFIASVATVALAAFATASAASADTTQYRHCSDDGDTGNTICYTINDVERQNTTKSGKTQTVETGTMLIEYFDPSGALIWDDKTQWHTNSIERDGETQVYHDQTRVKYTFEGEACTNGSNVTFANGEVRHLGPEWEWVCK